MVGAIAFDRPGPPSVLYWHEVPPLQPKPDEVVIAVEAAGVNNADLLIRRGAYPIPANGIPRLGLECAGRIRSVGSAVTEWSPGDRVCALLDGGGYADEVAVVTTQVMPIPDSVSFVDAAVIPEAACTVYSNLSMIAGLRPGRSVLIHGASGGIGSFAVQWASAIGAEVIATAGTDDKVRMGRQLGAQAVVNYRTHDFVAAVLEFTGGRGVDAILDVVGSEYLQRNLRCLAPDGHLVVIGGKLGMALLDLTELMAKRASMSATALRPRPVEQKADIVARVRATVLPLVAAGKIRPIICAAVPIRAAGEAHALLERGTTIGNVVLENRP